MRVAAIYDVHGNLPALDAVLDEVREAGVDEIVVGGDVLPGPMPRECLSRLLSLDVPTRFVYGNGERDVLALLAGEEVARVPEAFRGMMRWVADQLSPELADAIAAWPLVERMSIEGLGAVLFCHATPRDENEIFTRVTPADLLAPLFTSEASDLVVCGHTHMQFDRAVGDVRIVNAGSVGLPFGATGAFWILLDAGVEFRHTPYDVHDATEGFKATGYPMLSQFELINPASEDQMTELFEGVALKRGG